MELYVYSGISQYCENWSSPIAAFRPYLEHFPIMSRFHPNFQRFWYCDLFKKYNFNYTHASGKIETLRCYLMKFRLRCLLTLSGNDHSFIEGLIRSYSVNNMHQRGEHEAMMKLIRQSTKWITISANDYMIIRSVLSVQSGWIARNLRGHFHRGVDTMGNWLNECRIIVGWYGRRRPLKHFNCCITFAKD
jgi:hypothetical protein